MLNEKHINHSYNKIPPVCENNAKPNTSYLLKEL
jgi:hypothetical protein